MKTTVNLPEKALAEVMRYSKATTKTEAVAIAVADFNRCHRLAGLAKKMGSFKNVMTRDELRQMRGTD